MPKENLKDRVEGNELDLSLSDLVTVPVKELAAIPKATNIDLSCNLLVHLPDEFCRLTHLVSLDLSKNHLTQLPENFGSLQKLQHLDLFSNSIQTLPLSMYQLRNLKWLDLKENALVEPLKSIAGDCLDDSQCKNCAKNVVSYLKRLNSDKEREKQKYLAELRDKEVAKKAAEEKEKQRLKAEKKADKERRRREYAAAQAEKRHERGDEESEDTIDQENEQKMFYPNNSHEAPRKERVGLSCCGVLFTFFLGLIAVVGGIYFYCDLYNKDPMCRQTHKLAEQYYKVARKTVEHYVQKYT